MANNCMDSCFHYADFYHCIVNISHDLFLLSRPHIFGRGSLSVSFKDSRGISCRRTLRQWNGNFPSSYFNSVYSCSRFLFPVLLSTLPALPFLLFLHHYCPLLAKKRHCVLWRQHPVCQQSPKIFLTGVKHT